MRRVICAFYISLIRYISASLKWSNKIFSEILIKTPIAGQFFILVIYVERLVTHLV